MYVLHKKCVFYKNICFIKKYMFYKKYICLQKNIFFLFADTIFSTRVREGYNALINTQIFARVREGQDC